MVEYNAKSVDQIKAEKLYANYKAAIADEHFLVADSVRLILMEDAYQKFPESDSVVTHWAHLLIDRPEVKGIFTKKKLEREERLKEIKRESAIADSKANMNTLNTFLTEGFPKYDREAEVTYMTMWTNDLDKAKKLDDAELNKLVKKVEHKLIAHKIKRFGSMRKTFANDLREALWRENIDVKVSGKNNSTITFISGKFASNANKEDFQKLVSDELHKLRFKRAEYKWYKYDDEYTYYTINSKNDTD